MEDEITRLERELARVQETVAENNAALSALEEERHEREGRLALARRAVDDVERRLEEMRVELARAEAEAAVEAYEGMLRERTEAAEALAAAADTVTKRIREYEAAHERAANAWNALGAKRRLLSDPSGEPLARPEGDPPPVARARELLIELVRPWLDLDVERDLVEAAARSPMGHEIERLPEHLRALARERRMALLRGSRGRS